MEWMKSLIKTSKQDSLSSADDCEMLSATLCRNSKLHQLQVRTEVINIEAIVALQQNVLWTIQFVPQKPQLLKVEFSLLATARRATTYCQEESSSLLLSIIRSILIFYELNDS